MNYDTKIKTATIMGNKQHGKRKEEKKFIIREMIHDEKRGKAEVSDRLKPLSTGVSDLVIKWVRLASNEKIRDLLKQYKTPVYLAQ